GEGATTWMTVPTFGDWDMKNGAMPDYSMDFSKIREMHKQNKKELSRASLSGDDDLLAPQPTRLGAPSKDHGPLHSRDDSPTVSSFARSGSSFRCCLSCSLNLT
ncbi:hypothetical protein ZWY2020_004077, partial [Hordeum vulgare]